MKIQYTSYFQRKFKKIPRDLQQIVLKREEMFRENPFDPRLKTHKLQGKLKGYCSFSITYKNRILFEFITPQEVLFVDVDDHSIYQ